MRAVVQRVCSARVLVDQRVVGSIEEPGLLVLLGVHQADGQAEVEGIARKLAGLRILRDELSVQDVGAPILLVSQFTLYADTSRGRRPSWSSAAPAQVAEPIVDQVVARLSGLGLRVETGQFGADMQVELVNDGPVTLVIEV